LLAGVRLGLFSYWMNTDTGGAVAAAAGALVIGSLPRILKEFRARHFFCMAVGMAVLANSRPYEGLLVCIPACAAIGWSIWKRRLKPSMLATRVTPAAVLLIATLSFMGYYNHRLYGSPFTPAYKVNRDTYAVAPHFLWQSAKPEPVYRHRVLWNFYAGPDPLAEMSWYREQKGSIVGFLNVAGKKILGWAVFYINFGLSPLLIAIPWAVRDRRTRMVVAITMFYVTGLAVETWFIPHYAAAATVLLYILLMQCMRHLRLWGCPGLFLVRATPVLCVALAAFRVGAQPLHLVLPDDVYASQSWYGAGSIGMERARVASELERSPGRQLAIVRYVPNHMYPEWVYNVADIDGSKVVWAREMDAANNRTLLEYYKDRTVWLVEPDKNPPKVSPYPTAELQNSTLTSLPQPQTGMPDQFSGRASFR
jgi:hypothetical protein